MTWKSDRQRLGILDAGSFLLSISHPFGSSLTERLMLRFTESSRVINARLPCRFAPENCQVKGILRRRYRQG